MQCTGHFDKPVDDSKPGAAVKAARGAASPRLGSACVQEQMRHSPAPAQAPDALWLHRPALTQR